jgi:hypothetical protein
MSQRSIERAPACLPSRAVQYAGATQNGVSVGPLRHCLRTQSSRIVQQQAAPTTAQFEQCDEYVCRGIGLRRGTALSFGLSDQRVALTVNQGSS